jgi:two-component system alkaline phosphatase synthesis response regulator PhoP
LANSEDRKQRILLVEDEESLSEVVEMNLSLAGYEVTLARDGEEAIAWSRRARFDLCILDIMLPKIDGFTVCRTIRMDNNGIPILFLSAKSAGSDRVEGLKIGGDDYLTKPFHLEELLLRVSNLIRLHKLSTGESKKLDVVKFGNNQVNFGTFEIIGVDGREKTLSKREIQFLKFLIEREGEVVSREEILENVWGYDVYPSTRTIDNFILAFRKYFEANSREPRYFHSVRGVGYKFTF